MVFIIYRLFLFLLLIDILLSLHFYKHHHLYHPLWTHCFYIFSCVVHEFPTSDYPPIAVEFFVMFYCFKWTVFSSCEFLHSGTLLARVSTKVFFHTSYTYESSGLIVSLHVVFLSYKSQWGSHETSKK